MRGFDDNRRRMWSSLNDSGNVVIFTWTLRVSESTIDIPYQRALIVRPNSFSEAVSKPVPEEAARAVNAQRTKSPKTVRASHSAEHVRRGFTAHFPKGYRASHERRQGEAVGMLERCPTQARLMSSSHLQSVMSDRAFHCKPSAGVGEAMEAMGSGASSCVSCSRT
jgi:hypothetical protein